MSCWGWYSYVGDPHGPNGVLTMIGNRAMIVSDLKWLWVVVVEEDGVKLHQWIYNEPLPRWYKMPHTQHSVSMSIPSLHIGRHHASLPNNHLHQTHLLLLYIHHEINEYDNPETKTISQ